jgi:ATP-dependent Lhr-like helicase
MWIGRAAAGLRDGRIALFRREDMASLDHPMTEAGQAVPSGETKDATPHAVIRHHLAERGASFLFELIQALDRAGFKGGDLIEPTLWDLVWEGAVTNDTFAPLRGLSKGPASHRRAGASSMAGGRWSLVRDSWLDAPSTERLLGWARRLLERYGIVSREAVQAEALAGGFGLLYPVFKQMEERGHVRRGYFVEGLSGAQFALPAALERLRAAREEEPPLDGYGPEALCVLAAVDPANPYGTILPWPDTRNGRPPKRVQGAHLVLVAGKPLIYAGPGARQLLTFPASETPTGGELNLALGALHRLPRLGRGRLSIQTIDTLPALDSPLRERLLAAGFQVDGDALVPARGWS